MQHYEIIQQIGKGSYGKVYTARNYEDHELYVLKRVPFDDASRVDADAALREANMLSCLRHPHIVPYREFFHYEGDLCLVMAHCEGGDLYAHVKALRKSGNSVPEDQAWKWIVQCLLALQYCHGKRILHRDVKTQNIFLTKDGQVMLGDFGLAKSLQHTMEMAKTPIGTPFYMAPEIYEEAPYSYKSDVWAMGCVFYEMLAQKPAFGGENLSRVVLKVLKGTYDPLPASYSPEVRGMVDSMLFKRVQKRPTINDLLQHPDVAPKVQDYLAALSNPGAGCWSTWKMKLPAAVIDQVASIIEKGKAAAAAGGGGPGGPGPSATSNSGGKEEELMSSNDLIEKFGLQMLLGGGEGEGTTAEEERRRRQQELLAATLHPDDGAKLRLPPPAQGTSPELQVLCKQVGEVKKSTSSKIVYKEEDEEGIDHESPPQARQEAGNKKPAAS